MVKKRFLSLFVFITLIIIAIDQFLKYLVNEFNPNYILSFLTIHSVQNTGAGFGILQGQTLFLAIISLIVAFLVIFYYKKIPQEKVTQVLFALFLGGVIGNLVDRLFRGYVIDFIDFNFWPAFNIADAAITISVIGLIVWFWKN